MARGGAAGPAAPTRESASMKAFLRIERITTGIALAAAIFFLVAASGLSIFQVVTRFVFGSPSTWSEAAARSSMIWSVFMGVAPTFRHGAMISIDVIQTSLPRQAGRAVYLLAAALSFAFFVVLFWQGWNMTGRVLGQTMAGLRISISWAYAALPVGALFALVAIPASAVRALRQTSSPSAAEPLE